VETDFALHKKRRLKQKSDQGVAVNPGYLSLMLFGNFHPGVRAGLAAALGDSGRRCRHRGSAYRARRSARRRDNEDETMKEAPQS
jgi:hypothetical protein